MAIISGKMSLFKYKTTKGALHKLPSLLKFLVFLPLCIFCMSLPPLLLAAGIFAAATAAFLCKFTLREQLTDLKPAVVFAGLMYIISLLSNIAENPGAGLQDISILLQPRRDFLLLALKIILIVQLSALLFRSTSSVEIRESLIAIERFIRRVFSCLPVLGKFVSSECRFAQNISLFLGFIPEIFSNMTAVNLAWKARGGKQGLNKIKTTIFILISLNMEKAAVKAKALTARTLN